MEAPNCRASKQANVERYCFKTSTMTECCKRKDVSMSACIFGRNSEIREQTTEYWFWRIYKSLHCLFRNELHTILDTCCGQRGMCHTYRVGAPPSLLRFIRCKQTNNKHIIYSNHHTIPNRQYKTLTPTGGVIISFLMMTTRVRDGCFSEFTTLTTDQLMKQLINWFVYFFLYFLFLETQVLT